MLDYIKTLYNETNRPFTRYPEKLARYLTKRYNITGKFLDLGCGRGEYLKGFLDCGVDGYGVDLSPGAEDLCPASRVISKINFIKDDFPYPVNYFDVIFSKSVIEHFYYPEEIVRKIDKILKPGGLVITMVPDWETVYRIYYNDYSHRTSFRLNAIRELFLLEGFEDVKAEKFYQLPFFWDHPKLIFLCKIAAFLTPATDKYFSPSKFLFYSHYLTLLSSAKKPRD